MKTMENEKDVILKKYEKEIDKILTKMYKKKTLEKRMDYIESLIILNNDCDTDEEYEEMEYQEEILQEYLRDFDIMTFGL
jgi:hypothetical protein